MSLLLDFYKGAISVSDLTADEQGQISGGAYLNELKDALVNGRRMVLPTYEQQRRQDTNNLVILHPLKENIFRRGESPVLQSLRSWATRRARVALTVLLSEISNLCVDTSTHSRLEPEQLHVLKSINEMDAAAEKNLIDLISASSFTHSEYPLITISIRRPGARIGAESRRVHRIAAITFPLQERINALYAQEFGDKVKPLKGQKAFKEKRSINEVDIRKSDVQLFKRLFDLIIPNPSDTDYWVCDTDADMGPSFVSFLLVMRKFCARINEVVSLFESVVTDLDRVKYDESWFGTLDNLGSLKALVEGIPMQDGNEGNTAVDATTDIPAMNMNASIAAAPAVIQSLPVTTAAPAPLMNSNIMQQTTIVPPIAHAPMTRHPNIAPHANIVTTPINPTGVGVVYPGTSPQVINPGLAHLMPMNQQTQEKPKSLYGGNRVASLAEIAQEEHARTMEAIRVANEKAAQSFRNQQANQAAAPQMQPMQMQPMQMQPQLQQQQQVVHNGVIYQAVQQPQQMPQPVVINGVTMIPVGVTQQAQNPQTLNHLLPGFGMPQQMMGNMGMMSPANNLIAQRNAPLFGQTIPNGTSQINGGMMMNNGMRLA